MVETAVKYLTFLLLPMIGIYIHRILYFYRGLGKLVPSTNAHEYSVTIVVPARNEADNIERCLRSLSAQRYPKDKLSIIVIDDQSTDGTIDIVRQMIPSANFPLLVFSTTEHPDIQSPKVRALAHGIQHAVGEIILTTDADCVVPPDWVKTIVSYFDDRIGIVTGVTVFERPKDISSLFWGIQFLDFISYTSIAAGAIGWGKLLISNGSNMAFRRKAFDDAGGYETLKHINTGDDSLLAQQIVNIAGWQPQFAFSPQAIVTTKPATTLREMFHQRMRWVGQTAYYPPYMMFFLITTFLMFVLLAIAIPLTFVYWNIIPWIVLTAKFTVDYMTMLRFTRVTGTEHALRFFIPTAIIHIPLVLLATIGGYFFAYEWKNRSMKRETSQ